jgi:hypothetical protein
MKRYVAPEGFRLWLATNKMRLTMHLAQRASLGKKGPLDKAVTGLLSRMLSPKNPEDDYMRDELVDADISFSTEELERYQRQGQDPAH